MFTMSRALNAVRRPKRAWEWLFSHDYQSPGLTPFPADMLRYFPNLKRENSWNAKVAHIQRRDRRFPGTGVVSWDESTLLYNYARLLAGKDLLEIGCWIGWSTVLMGLGGCRITVVDPVLGGMPQGDACREAIRQAGLEGSIELIGGYSPEAIEELTARGRTWSACFIDGNHEEDAPLRDAQACVPAARDDCVFFFHDVIRPNVAEALTWMKQQGWNVGIHYTCWIIGVAWRGDFRPLAHTPDPKVGWDAIVRDELPHLAQFPRL